MSLPSPPEPPHSDPPTAKEGEQAIQPDKVEPRTVVQQVEKALEQAQTVKDQTVKALGAVQNADPLTAAQGLRPEQPTVSLAVPPVKTAEQQMRQHTRRGFIRGGAAAAAALLGWTWLRSRSDADGIPWPLRGAHRFNEWVWGGTYSNGRLAPEFPATAAGEPMVNGQHGWPADTAPAAWKLIVSQPGVADRTFRLTDLRGLPQVEMTTELKCIEGWSQVVTWGGVRLADFVAAHGLGRRSGSDWYPYVSLATPDEEYYVGLDTPSALHPQTLLCDRLNGAPLPASHGGPLRLVITVKYGIKNIKWLGRARFQEDRPADYWAERGYDWYAGL